MIPGVRVTHARDHLLDHFGYQLGLVLMDVMATLARQPESGVWDERGQRLVRRAQVAFQFVGGELLLTFRQGERPAVGEDGQGHRWQW